jgi:hypothetical protein
LAESDKTDFPAFVIFNKRILAMWIKECQEEPPFIKIFVLSGTELQIGFRA